MISKTGHSFAEMQDNALFINIHYLPVSILGYNITSKSRDKSYDLEPVLTSLYLIYKMKMNIVSKDCLGIKWHSGQ